MFIIFGWRGVLDGIIDKIKEIIAKRQGKSVGESYLLNSMYPITFLIDKIPDADKPRIIQLLYSLITHKNYNIKAQIHIIDGEKFGDPQRQMLIFLVDFKTFNPVTGKYEDLPDSDVIRFATQLAESRLPIILQLAGIKNFVYMRGMPPYNVLKEIGFNSINLSEIARKNIQIYKFDIQEVARLLGIQQPTQIQPRMPTPQVMQGQQPIVNPSMQGLNQMKHGFNQGMPQMNHQRIQQLNLPQSSPITEVPHDIDFDIEEDISEVEGGVFDTGSMIEKLKGVWESNGFNYHLARKYQILNYIMKSEDYKEIFNETVKNFENKKPMWVFHLGITYDGTHIYYPFVNGENNHSAIFGIAGSGKSYGASIFLEEAILRGIPVIVISNNSEWDVLKNIKDAVTPDEVEKIYNNPSFFDPENGLKVQKIIPKSMEDEIEDYDDTFQISLEDITLEDFKMIMSLVSSGGKDLGSLQESVLVHFFDMVSPRIEVQGDKKVKKVYKFIDKEGNERIIKTFEDMYEFFRAYTDEELAHMFELDKKRASTTLAGIKNRLYMLKRNKYTNRAIGDKKLPIDKIDKPNTVTIIRMPSISSSTDLSVVGISMIMLFRIMSEINRYRGTLYEKYNQITPYPIIIFIDEAHNYFSSKLESILGKDLAKRFIDQIITAYKEQRKFGVAYFIASQNPSDIHPDLMAQISNVWVGRISKNDAGILQNLFNIDQQLVKYFLEMSQKYHEFFLFSSILESTSKPILMKWKKSKVKV